MPNLYLKKGLKMTFIVEYTSNGKLISKTFEDFRSAAWYAAECKVKGDFKRLVVDGQVNIKEIEGLDLEFILKEEKTGRPIFYTPREEVVRLQDNKKTDIYYRLRGDDLSKGKKEAP